MPRCGLMHNTALEGSTGMNETKQKKKNFYLEHAEAFEPGALDPALADRIRHDFRLLKPLYAFLQNAMTRTV